jgi:hypothetical protein
VGVCRLAVEASGGGGVWKVCGGHGRRAVRQGSRVR